MQDLVPASSYDVDDTGYWKRMPLSMGLFMAVAGTAIQWATVGHGRGFTENAVLGVMAGAIFAAIVPPIARRMHRAYTTKALAGAGPFSTAPPLGCDAEYRVVCSAIRGDARHAVGGVLYLGRSAFAFVPFSGTPALFHLSRTTVRPVMPVVSPVQRAVIPRPPQQLELVDDKARARIILPTAAATIEKIEELLTRWGHVR
jgi:hypothetical protein